MVLGLNELYTFLCPQLKEEIIVLIPESKIKLIASHCHKSRLHSSLKSSNKPYGTSEGLACVEKFQTSYEKSGKKGKLLGIMIQKLESL